MTDDGSDLSPSDSKIEFIPENLFQFTLNKISFSFIFVDFRGGAKIHYNIISRKSKYIFL